MRLLCLATILNMAGTAIVAALRRANPTQVFRQQRHSYKFAFRCPILPIGVTVQKRYFNFSFSHIAIKLEATLVSVFYLLNLRFSSIV